MVSEELKQFSDRWEPLKATPGIISVSDKLTTKALAGIEVFSTFDNETLARLIHDVAVVQWNGESEVFHEGAYTDTAYLILNGHVKLSSSVIKEEFALPLMQERTNLLAGDIFGETGTVSGWPQTYTAVTLTQCELLHIRTAALRLMRRKNKPLHAALESQYKKQGLIAQLKSIPIFSRIPELALAEYADSTILSSFEPGDIISTEGQSAEYVYIVRAGFVKMSKRMGDAEVVLNYLKRGEMFCEMEFIKRPSRYYATASAVEYVDIISIPFDVVESLLQYNFSMISNINQQAKQVSREYKERSSDLKRSALMQFSMESGTIEGTSIFVIDLDRCTRCDDCVRGCADTHRGLPRFVREGSRYENFLVTRACYQCSDPMCLVGCPTGAIRRAGMGKVVEINDNLCIGCKVCAVNCPYDAIVMHDTGEFWGQDALPAGLRGKERLLASKCDLCAGLDHGPACVESCPIGCAVRVGSLEGLSCS